MANLPDRRPSPELPSTIELLHIFILVGKEKVKAHKAKLRAIDKVGVAQAARGAALQDAQDVAELVLDAESKLGELLGILNNSNDTETV